MQQSNSLCLAVNPPPFDKGGKSVGGFRGDSAVFKRVSKAVSPLAHLWQGTGRFSAGGVAIPPVAARIFSGDSTSPLARGTRMWCGAKGGVAIPQSCDR